jgi:hypothetical protein
MRLSTQHSSIKRKRDYNPSKNCDCIIVTGSKAQIVGMSHEIKIQTTEIKFLLEVAIHQHSTEIRKKLRL